MVKFLGLIDTTEMVARPLDCVIQQWLICVEQPIRLPQAVDRRTG